MINNIKTLAEQSYKDNILDAQTVSYIADHLNRHELKDYIRFLKNEEHKKEVIVTVPKELNEKDKKMITQMFTDKNIIYMIDPKMISGIKITNGDVEYEISLNQMFHDIMNYINAHD